MGYEGVRYDALLDQYETGLTVARVDPLFGELRDSVAPLVRAVVEKGERPDIMGRGQLLVTAESGGTEPERV